MSARSPQSDGRYVPKESHVTNDEGLPDSSGTVGATFPASVSLLTCLNVSLSERHGAVDDDPVEQPDDQGGDDETTEDSGKARRDEPTECRAQPTAPTATTAGRYPRRGRTPQR